MIGQALFTGYDPPLRVVDGADFDGTNDYMNRGGGLTGAADSKLGIVSFWIRIDGGNGSSRYIFYRSSGSIQNYIEIDSANKIWMFFDDSTNSPVVQLSSASTYLASATWLHILASWDLANTTGHYYINDVSAPGDAIFTNNTIDYTLSDTEIGAAGTVGKFNGCIADLYFAPGQYLDFSLVSNRRKFISASGKPVHLGTDGSLPTGTAPIMYHHIDDGEAVANFATNRGTGGNFTITGSLDTASSSPSD